MRFKRANSNLLAIAFAVLFSACGYSLTRGAAEPLGDFRVGRVVNLTSDGALTSWARAELEAKIGQPSNDATAQGLELSIRTNPDRAIAFADDGFSAIDQVTIIIELKLSTKHGTQWWSGPVRSVRAFYRRRSAAATEAARRSAMREALGSAIVDAVERLRTRFFKRQRAQTR